MSIYSIMRKILFIFSAILLQNIARAQFNENFSDGDFTTNPAWIGEEALFKVNPAFQLQLNASGEGIAALSAESGMLNDMEWNFWVKLSFAPSDNNLTRIYLSSDQSDLKGSLSGYYLKLGETGADDAIELVKQSGNVHTVICRSTDGLLAASFAIRIRVIRSDGGQWKIFADPLGGINYQLQAGGVDNTIGSGAFFGVYCKFTSSNSTKFYFDDFYAGQVIVDNTSPELLSVSITSARQLSVAFNEAVDAVTAADVNNYTATPGSLTPVSAITDNADPALVHLNYAQDFTPDVLYSLAVSGVKDLAGNVISTIQLPFVWHQVKAYEVLINEIMADPSPPVNLPDAEYVELCNRGIFDLDLKDWVMVIGSSEKLLPGFSIPAGGYVILCDDATKALLEPYGRVIEFSSFAVTNAGGTITLKDPNGNVIHSVSYTDDWYQSEYKKDGGWSLELIDPLNPCGETANWIACNADAGGTPGSVNSVNALNPDLVPPAISRVGVDDASHITVWFTESCDSANITNPLNYTIDNGIGNPIGVWAQNPDYRQAFITLPSPLAAGMLYTIRSTNSITDCAGNPFLEGASAQFAIPSAAAANDIVINEMLFDPADGCVDFVEVYNRSQKVIDLKDLILANYDTINQVVTSYNEISKRSFLVLPGTYFVLTTDSAAVKRNYKAPNPLAFVNMGTFPEMNNDNGLIAVTAKGGEVIDLAAYSVSMQYPLLSNVDGVSLERISPGRSSKDATNWHSAAEAVGFATPAYINSQFGTAVTDQNEITLSPDIFSPDNDGYNDNLAIAYSFGTPGNNATVTIFDATGRLVRNLVNHELCGTTGAFSWDGITNDRLKASIGRYIVSVEIFDLQGNVKRYKKSAILGGKL